MNITDFSAYWLTVPSGLVMFGWLIYELRRSRPNDDLKNKAIEFKEKLRQQADLNRAAMGRGFNKATLNRKNAPRRNQWLKVDRERLERLLEEADVLIPQSTDMSIRTPDWQTAVAVWFQKAHRAVEEVLPEQEAKAFNDATKGALINAQERYETLFCLRVQRDRLRELILSRSGSN